jgi:hypothetical protein
MKKLLGAVSITVALLTGGLVVLQQTPEPPVQHNFIRQKSIIDRMPIVDSPYTIYSTQLAPVEQRGPEVRQWLAPSLKISVSGASGSGTIVYYDNQKNIAYVQSCGHLWDGNMSAEEGIRRRVKCVVIAWYHNDVKLSQPKEYNADVIYWSNTRGRDCSLLKFQPDWKPEFFPLGPSELAIAEGTRLHSMGCDGGREVAHYDVRAVGERSVDFITTENSPRPGRSGGGLVNDNGFYVGICWGTSDKSGNGIGYFTPLRTVREMNRINGYGWLNDQGGSIARKIPILDRNNSQGKYPLDYIPLPLR